MNFSTTRPSEDRSSELDPTPLVGVLILSTMFVVISLYFQNLKANERARLPVDRLVSPPSVAAEQELVLNFGYSRTRDRRRETVPTVIINDRRIEIAALEPELERQRRALQSQGGVESVGGVTVQIRADADVPSGDVQDLIQRCRASGFANFSLTTANVTGIR